MSGQDVPWLLNHWATNKPEHPFLIWEPRDGSTRTWTYAQFLIEAKNLAAGLAARGVVTGDKVLLHADNSPEQVIAWFACALLGAVGVTTNTKSAGPEIEYFAAHTRCVAGITQPQYAAAVAANAPQLSFLAVTADNSGEAPSQAELAESAGLVPFSDLFGDGSTLASRPAEPMLPVGIMFTSGTTSRPKAVVHTHANVIWSSRLGPDNIHMAGDDRYLIYLPYFHVNAQSWSTWTTLGVGGTIVLMPKWSASRFWEIVVKHDITHFSMMPFVMKAAMSVNPLPQNKLKVGAFGLISPQIEQMMGGIRITSSWGMTETVIHATRNQFDQFWPQGTMGRPTPGYEFLVVDTENNRICDPGENGELYVRGTRGIQLFLEYFDNDEANANAFTDDGWFKTGDRVILSEDGFFFFKDRDKDALKVGGENVSAKEVEDVCRMVPGVTDVAIVGQDHDFLSMVAVAFVIAAPNAPADLGEQIMKMCASRLADFKCPKAVYLVDDFPRATLDKVAKNKLREMADSYVAK